jgi:hypothetical protein
VIMSSIQDCVFLSAGNDASAAMLASILTTSGATALPSCAEGIIKHMMQSDGGVAAALDWIVCVDSQRDALGALSSLANIVKAEVKINVKILEVDNSDQWPEDVDGIPALRLISRNKIFVGAKEAHQEMAARPMELIPKKAVTMPLPRSQSMQRQQPRHVDDSALNQNDDRDELRTMSDQQSQPRVPLDIDMEMIENRRILEQNRRLDEDVSDGAGDIDDPVDTRSR